MGNVMFRSNKYESKIKLFKPENVFSKHKFEVLSIFLFASFVMLLLSLVSYNSTDSSWFYISTAGRPILNWCGVIGANISALLFYLFGSAAYVVAFGVAYFAYLVFINNGFTKDSKRILSYSLFTVSLATILNSYSLDFTNSYPGGFVGRIIASFMQKPFGLVGSRVIIFSVLLVSGVIASRVSFFRLSLQLTKLVFYFSKILIRYIYKASKLGLKYAFKGVAFLAVYIKKQIASFFYSDENILDDFFIQKSKGSFNSEFTVPKGFSDNIVSKVDEPEVDINLTLQNEDIQNLSEIISNGKSLFGEKQIRFSICHTFNHYLIGKDIRYKFMLKPGNAFLKLFRSGLPNSVFNKNIFSLSFSESFIDALKKDKVAKKESLFSKIKKVSHFKEAVNVVKKKEYVLPNINLFERATKSDEALKKELVEQGELNGELLEEKLSHFGIKGKVTAIKPGPVITLFEYKPEIDSKISKIIALEDDLALALRALSIRIVAPIPGRSVVGFEISNNIRQTVPLSQLLESKYFKTVSSTLPVVVGVDIVGRPVIQDLVTMPHLLVAGSTGSGKSVGLNAMLVSLLCEFNPDQLKLILIDPKRLEFAPYKDIPHLLFPIITNPRQAAPVLKWLVQEMETRYDKMAEVGVRNISEYQEEAKSNLELEPMPFIVLMIDELADLMMVAGKDIELHIARIAQMARAAGIHMIVATQRPSVDVVTGLIKVNFPSRMAFRVTSKIDSRTIVDAGGAEKLLGKGDMLYMSSGSSDLQRIHGAFVGVKEIEKLTKHLRAQGKPQYLDLNETLKEMTKSEVETIEDDLYPDVIEFVRTIDELSISGLQRKYRIGFNRSARLIEKLELDGFVAPAQGSKPRKVLKENLR